MAIQAVEKRATGTFFEDYVAKIFHLWGAFFLEKSAPHPCKKAPYHRIPFSAENGLGLCPKYPPLFEKSGQKL